MIDVTSDEFKQAVRERFFSHPVIASGIVQIVNEPLKNACSHHRCMAWNYESLDEYVECVNSEYWAGCRVGDFVSVSIRQALFATISGVVESSQLNQPELDGSDHTLVIVPDSFLQSLALTWHTCPSTKMNIASYNGKRVVRAVFDKSIKKPCLLYPGEIQLFFRTPTPEVELNPEYPDSFIYHWQYDVSVAGFEYTGPENPKDKDLSNPEFWKHTGKSRIVQVG